MPSIVYPSLSFHQNRDDVHSKSNRNEQRMSMSIACTVGRVHACFTKMLRSCALCNLIAGPQQYLWLEYYPWLVIDRESGEKGGEKGGGKSEQKEKAKRRIGQK